jgi:hypothetical protein
MSCEPNSAWAPWRAFDPDPGEVSAIGVGQLSDGRLQLWVVPWPFTPGSHLQTTWKTSRDPNSTWAAPWQTFNPDPGTIVEVIAEQLWDGRLKLWALVLPAGKPPTVLTVEKTSAIADAPWWTNWQPFG